jgi:hypothetical protein
VGLGTAVLVISLAFGAVASDATASGATVSGTGVSTGAVLNSTRAAIASQTSAHVVFTGHSSSTSTTEKIIADVGRTSGTEDISEGSAAVAIRVTPSFAYVSGNASGLTTLFGLSASQARKVGHKWVSWKAGTSQYKNLHADLTMSSVTALLPKAKGTTVSTKTVGGVGLYVLTWTTAATSSVPRLSNTLTISSGAPVLPISDAAKASGGTKITTALSKWGEVVVVATPPASSIISAAKAGA